VEPAIAGPLASRPQHRGLDWGDGRQVRITYKPEAASWSILAGVRYGRANSSVPLSHSEQAAGPVQCAFLPTGPYGALCNPAGPYASQTLVTGTNWSDASVNEREDHVIADFAVGKDVGMGMLGDSHSNVSAGLRYAQFDSTTRAVMHGIPDWNIPEGWFKYPSTHHEYQADVTADRKFKGAGPTLSWSAAQRLRGNEQAGHLDVDWSVTGGVLFGKQKTKATGTQAANEFSGNYFYAGLRNLPPLSSEAIGVSPRDKSATVPLVDLSLGLSYEIQRVKVGAGYHWERYYNVLDAGYAERKEYDRTIDGPYFKIAVGFGG
jgi:hypothetical protein